MATVSPPTPVRYEQGDAALLAIREWCKGCDLCIRSCPTGILSLADDGRIQVEDISRCIFCGICAARCPDFVFFLERPADSGRRTAEGG